MESQNSIIDRIYEAALVPEAWIPVLESLTEIAGAKAALLHSVRDYAANRTLITPRAQEMFDRAREGDWWRRNTRGNVLLSLSPNEFHSDADHISPEAMAEMPIYRDLLWKTGFGYAVANHVLVPNGDTLILSIEKSREDGPVAATAVKELTAIRPHFARAAMLASRLTFERIQSANEAFAMTGLPSAAINEAGQIIHCNALFETATDLFSIGAGNRLRLGNDEANRILEECLATFRARTDNAKPASRSLALPRSCETDAAVLHLVPVKGNARDIFSMAAFFIILTPLAGARDAPTELIQGLFDLTAMEARVAQALAGGKDINMAAENFGISRETVRHHLKNIFSKTGYSRQTDLAAAISMVRRIE